MHPDELTPSDHYELSRLMNLYVTILDDDTMDRLSTLFTPDGVFDLSPFGGGQIGTGLDGIAALCNSLPPARHPHLSSNMLLSEGDGPVLHIRSRYFGPSPNGPIPTGEYRDEAVRTADGWRLRRRTAFPWKEQP